MAFGGHPTLETDLVSAWELSADGSDAHGANDLTNNNGVTFVAKGVGAPANMPGTVANFVAASSQDLIFSPSSPDVIPSTGSWSEIFWFKHTGQDYGSIIGDSPSSAAGHVLFSRNNGTVDLYMSGGSDTIVNVAAAANVWHLAYISYTTGTNVVSISIDNGTPVTDTLAGAYAPVTAQQFKIGNNTRASYFTGLVSSVFIYSRVLTSDERTDLWADGDGLFYGTASSEPEPIIYRGRTAKYFYWDI